MDMQPETLELTAVIQNRLINMIISFLALNQGLQRALQPYSSFCDWTRLDISTRALGLSRFDATLEVEPWGRSP